MNIKKMMLLASMALTAIAFAAPAAQAQVLYEKGAGGTHVPLANGAKLTATSTNLVTKSAVGELTCAKVTVHGEVVANAVTGSHIKDLGTTVEGCSSAITGQTGGTITLNPGNVGSADNATFIVNAFCHFAGNIPFTYVTNTDTLTVAGANQFSGFPNPPCGGANSATMSGSFTLETENGTEVLIT